MDGMNDGARAQDSIKKPDHVALTSPRVSGLGQEHHSAAQVWAEAQHRHSIGGQFSDL